MLVWGSWSASTSSQHITRMVFTLRQSTTGIDYFSWISSSRRRQMKIAEEKREREKRLSMKSFSFLSPSPLLSLILSSMRETFVFLLEMAVVSVAKRESRDTTLRFLYTAIAICRERERKRERGSFLYASLYRIDILRKGRGVGNSNDRKDSSDVCFLSLSLLTSLSRIPGERFRYWSWSS